MARIRTTKPEFWTDGKVVGMSPFARLLFLGSWNFALCDDGHLRDHQKVDGRWTPRCFVCSHKPAETQPVSSELPETRASLEEARGDSPQEGKGKERKGREIAARKRATQAPDSIDITDAMRTWAASKAPRVDLTSETERFLDHHRAKGSTFKDWTAAWRTWMSRAEGYGNVRQLPNRDSDNAHAGKVRMVEMPGGRWREVHADEVLYGVHTEWRVPS
jgi:hypothetical protein